MTLSEIKKRISRLEKLVLNRKEYFCSKEQLDTIRSYINSMKEFNYAKKAQPYLDIIGLKECIIDMDMLPKDLAISIIKDVSMIQIMMETEYPILKNYNKKKNDTELFSKKENIRR